jgi:hypothetical protein
VYIGSSNNIGFRLVQHLRINPSNERLLRALNKYGLENFTFAVVEIFEVDPKVSMKTNKANLLAMEQKYLKWVFSLRKELCYNFLPIAGSPLGYKHTEETRAKKSGANHPMFGKTHSPESLALMSDSHTGKTHTPETRGKMSDSRTGKTRTPETRLKISETMTSIHTLHTPETRAKMSDSKSGTLNPMFGKISGNAMSINVYSLDNKLVRSFTSQVAAAKWLGVSNITVSNYIKSGKVWNKLYTFRKSTLLK